MKRKLAVVTLALCAMWAQAPAPTPEGPKSEPAEKPPAPPVLENSGKPMVLPFHCTDDDMQWAGMSCTEEDPCPVYLELAGVDSVGNRIVTLGNIHSESITLYSILLVSEDGGSTWREPFERLRGVGLDHVQFIDFQNGWISGQSLVPVMRDPFMLITSDGGKSWRQRSIFGEGGGGAVQQFWFESATQGELVIDRMQSVESSRYELYESPNGGDTWMIRRTSNQPITIRRRAAATSDPPWRVHADARTKSFVIQTRRGEQWQAVASFLVRMGACKPAPKVTPPPEPVEAAQPAAIAPQATSGVSKPRSK